MQTGVKFSKAKKSYRPSDALVSLLVSLLQYEKKEQELEKRIAAGGMDEEQIEAEKDVLGKEKELLVKRKVDVLNNHIFPAMANLTVLLEKMRDKPYIRGTFEDNVKALFLTKSNFKDKDTDKSIFQRFIEASSLIPKTNLMSTELGLEGDPLPDYRLILCRIMHQSVNQAMRDIAPQRKFDDPDFAEETMMVDMRRALAWTKEISHKAWINEVSHGAAAKLHSHRKRRPALF